MHDHFSVFRWYSRHLEVDSQVITECYSVSDLLSMCPLVAYIYMYMCTSLKASIQLCRYAMYVYIACIYLLAVSVLSLSLKGCAFLWHLWGLEICVQVTLCYRMLLCIASRLVPASILHRNESHKVYMYTCLAAHMMS